MITTESLSLKDMRRAERDGAVCGECGNNLIVAFINGEMVLRCRDLKHSTITYRDKQRESKIMEARMDSTQLMTMGETKMMERVNMSKFPQDLNQSEKMMLATVAMSYGFDPLMGEITIYQGKPFISIDGRYRKAQETGRLAGIETRPANKQERMAWEIPDGDYFFRSEVYCSGSDRPFVGWGRVRAIETRVPQGKEAYKPIQNNPQRMAEKRAESQALRKAFHIPLPSIEDIGTPDSDDYSVSESTGEVINVTAEVVDNQEPKPSPIDLTWLNESLKALQAAKLRAWTNAEFIKYCNGLTGADAKSVTDAVSKLNQEQASVVVNRIEETLKLM